ncbi:MAG: asparagine synthase (glutamine-hydrolyzing), partial [Alphaproteobacteria bacterium]|nr:asparagine synthase (glutamine-hydrolyzing) [Alphaproteobacteria bacterium]
MCGIFSVFDFKGRLDSGRENAFRAALRTLSHRGPDDEGWLRTDRHFLGHRRLSIMDLSSAGHQPMVSPCGGVTMVFNGQIYNWKQLRTQLEGLGHVFASQCDTESILLGYLEWGEEIFTKLTGMWAVVLVDERAGKLVVSRDRLGIKPLYEGVGENGELIFASEIKAIRPFVPGADTVDTTVAKRYMARGWLDDVSKTLYTGVRNFPAGCISVWENGVRRDRRFWTHPIPQRRATDIRAMRDLLIEVVDDHTQSDAPLATTLSGGIDSSTINAIMARELGKRTSIHAFSVDAPDIPDESPLIDETVRELGIQHEYICLNHLDYIREIDAMLDVHDEPTFSVGQLNQFMFRKKVHERGYKVLLVGDGADEVLAGYAKIVPMYVSALMDAGLNEQAEQVLHLSSELTGLGHDEAKSRLDLFRRTGVGGRTVQEYRFGYEMFSEAERPVDARMGFHKTHDQIRFLPSGQDLFQELLDRMIVDIPQILRNEDRNGMAHGIEIRPVFLDHRLIELAWSYPF